MKKILFIVLISHFTFSQSSFEKGEKLFLEKNFQEAKPFFELQLKANPNDLKTIEYLGDIAGHQKKWDEAIKCFSILKNKIPTKAIYFFKYGGALAMKAKTISRFKAFGMIDEIESSFLKAAKLDKKQIETRWALVMFYSELPIIIGGGETKAKKYADELLTISKVDGYLAHGYIQVYNKNYKKAEPFLIAAHRIGNSKTTFEKLYELYLNKIKDVKKAQKLKEDFNKK